MKSLVCLLVLSCALYAVADAQQMITGQKEAGAFAVVSAGETASVLVDAREDSLVHRVAALFRDDVEKVSGRKIPAGTSLAAAKNIVVIGTIGQSGFLRQLVNEKKLNVDGLKGRWEAYRIQVVRAPFKGVEQALVIAGSDRRGAAFGALELTQQMGVSPWYWWADVPVKKKNEIFIKANAFLSDAPKVKYRGIFLNDEAPALSSWSRMKFGGFNHHFYEKVFELLLRLKANYLWPAMWGNAFNDDDKLNPVLADQWGIVMGTSHHEPMLRAQQEWKRFGKGAWDYTKNDSVLRAFWKQGIGNMGRRESIVTIGMRGDGDEPMTEGTATALLENIVKDQRRIIEDVTGKPASATPQLWALYKEVQDYYDKGMRVPDDVTLLLCDDNWGNIRKLPKLNEKQRAGGYGIYYHFDYVGGPRNYKWLNTNNIARVWEQMHLAWEYNARQIWIVNVGDLKPMELPISFFLDYGWNPEKWNEGNLRTYYHQWADAQFGSRHAGETADLLRLYSQYSARRKPELLNAGTYGREEWEKVMAEWERLLQRAEKGYAALPAGYGDSYFQLVLHPIKAMTILHRMYRAAALNRWYAAQNNPLANTYADSVQAFFAADSLLTLQYHNDLAGGKWKGMMSQVHIGYTYWQQPPANVMPEVKRVTGNATAQEAVNKNSTSRSPENLIPPAAAAKGNLFSQKDNYVSIEAEHFTRTLNTNGVTWKVIPDISRTRSGLAPFPVTAPGQMPGKNSPHAEYDFYTEDSGRIDIQAFFSPTLNFHSEKEGLRYAVSIDDEEPQIISVNKDDNNERIWNDWVASNINVKKSEHLIPAPGKHVLKFWMVSPGVVLQKLVIGFGPVKPSYLGPDETLYSAAKK